MSSNVVSSVDDDTSVGSYSTVHTFQSSRSAPLRKEPPVMKKPGQRKKSGESAGGGSRAVRRGAVLPISRSSPPDDNVSSCSSLSASVHTFTSFEPLDTNQILSSSQRAPDGDDDDDDDEEDDDEVRSSLNIVKDKTNEISARSDSFGAKARSFEMQRSSSLFSLSHAPGSKVEQLYMTNSIHENLALHVRCGYAQRKNNRKYMEDCITVCPSIVAHNEDTPSSSPPSPAAVTAASGEATGVTTASAVAWESATAAAIAISTARDEQKEKTSADDDFAFFGVFDGHDGAYVSQYLQDHLLTYFREKLLSTNISSPPHPPNSPSSNVEKLESIPIESGLSKWRTSFLEAACKIDREILLHDAGRLQDLSDKRMAAFEREESDVERSSGDSAPQSTFAGSTAAVVIVHREQTQQYSPHLMSPSSPSAKHEEVFGGSKALSPSPWGDDEEDDVDNEGDDQFHEDVVVGFFANGHGEDGDEESDGNGEAEAHNDGHEHHLRGPAVPGLCVESSVARFQSRAKNMTKRHSSVDSAYDAPAVVLNLDDDNLFDVLESINNKQAHPFGLKTFKTAILKRDSNTSNISDLTQSYGNLSFLHSSDDVLQHMHSQPFNPKRKSLLAAVRRCYEVNSTEDFSAYEASQLEELVDDFLLRASILDKAASQCRGQAAELLQVLQLRVRSSNDSHSHSHSESHTQHSKSISNSEASSASPYMSSLDASRSGQSSAPSARSERSGGDDVSDISQATGLQSLKSHSSVSTLHSLRSFEDEPLKVKTSARVTALDTVSECLFESRATSFATSRQASLSSHVSRGAGFNESLRLALMGEIANKNIKLLVAHTGDCRVVLCDGGTAVQVTTDHTPLLDAEKWRIRESGGFVSNKRVNGILAVSRSFGDIRFKSFDKSLAAPSTADDEILLPEGIWSNRNQVISMPEVLEMEVFSTYEFVVIASDCVWETLSCSEVVLFVRAQLLDHADSMRAAEALATKVSDEGGADNCSIIVVNLNQI